MDPEWQERAENHLYPWYKEAVAMAQTLAYIIDQCDRVSKGFLMHAQDCDERYFFDILQEFKGRYAVDVSPPWAEPEFECRHPSACLVSVCRELYPDLYEDDVWNPYPY